MRLKARRDRFDHDVAERFPATLVNDYVRHRWRPTRRSKLAPLKLENRHSLVAQSQLRRFAAQGLTQSDHQQQDPDRLPLLEQSGVARTP
jgi:hypothetical protein